METGYRVGEVMTNNPVSVGPRDSLADCAEKMDKFNVGALLVTEDRNIHGIITQGDIVRRAFKLKEIPHNIKVQDIMQPDVVTVAPDKDIHEALMLMSNMNIKHLPVVEKEELVGLLTNKDVLKLEPQLFELISHRIELREDERKMALKEEEDLYL